MKSLLKVSDLRVHFDTLSGTVRANNGVNLEIWSGESVGVMGESGCGKTVLVLSLLKLQQPGRIVSGRICFDGKDIVSLPEHEMQPLRGRVIALVPQNQATALNPAYTVRKQLTEAVSIRKGGTGLQLAPTGSAVDQGPEAGEIAKIFASLGFETGPVLERILRSYPHQLSGGMRQRVLIAMALLLRPRLLIADEPTTALDRAIKVQALDTLLRLRGNLSMIVVSHDVDTIRAACDRVAIMYGGRMIEAGRCDDVLLQPRHPYSRALLAAQRRNRGKPLAVMAGETLDLIDFPAGCPFHPRCPQAMTECSTTPPPEYTMDGSMVACHLYRGGTC